MSEWIGHSVVAAIVGLVIFSASVSKKNVDEVVVSTIQVRAGKKVVLDFAAAVERDIRNIGANFPGYEVDPDSSVLKWKTDSTYNYFEFIGQPGPSEPPATIRYQWEVVDSTSIDGDMKSLYQISRLVDGVLSGQSASTFTNVSFRLLTDTGQPAVFPEEVRKIAIEVMAISSLGSPESIRETRWYAVYRPQAIARQDNDDA